MWPYAVPTVVLLRFLKILYKEVCKMENLLILLLLVVCFRNSECLACYQCADTTVDGVCQTDFEGMEIAYQHYTNNKTHDKKDSYPPAYYKNCSETDNSCIIEKVAFKGEMLAYIRDCSDGQTFSVSTTGRLNISGSKLPVNNYTTCTYKENSGVVCISLCHNDMCNGPRGNSAIVTTGSAAIITSTLIVLGYIVCCDL